MFAIRKNNRLSTTLYKKGQAMFAMVLIVLGGSTLIIYGISSPVAKEQKVVRNLVQSKQSFIASESGVEDVTYRIRSGLDLDSAEVLSVGTALSTISISDISSSEKEIISIGDEDDRIRTSDVHVRTGTGASFFYGIQSGDGGMLLGENAVIQAVAGAQGNVYSNGSIIGGNNSSISGSVTVAGGSDPDLLGQSTSCDADEIVGQADPKIDHAQSFTISESGPLVQISLNVKKIGNPADRDIRLVADNAGEPGTSTLTKGKLKGSLVGSAYSWINLQLDNPYNVTEGETYWIVFDAKRDANKYWIWCKDSSGGYANGSALYSKDWSKTSESWVSISGDMAFIVYIGTGATVLQNVDVGGDAWANAITDISVGGDAFYQTISNSTVAGSEFPGSADAPPVPFPISDANIDEWKLDAGCGTDPPQASCLHTGDFEADSDIEIGPLTITGDFETESNNLDISLGGIVYVHGNVDISNGTNVHCSASLGPDSCLIVTDGWIHTDQNTVFSGSGHPDSFMMMLTTLGCGVTTTSGCTHHGSAADLHEGTVGSIVFAPNGLLHFHNNANFVQVTANKIELKQNAVIEYEQGLINPFFSAGPGTAWRINSWEETE